MRKPRTPAKSARRSEDQERTVQSSISLRPSQWERLDVLADLTRWGRSGTVAEAVELLTELPVTLTQRLATLKRTTAASTLQARLRTAVEEAVAAAEDELGNDPHAEFAAALIAVGKSVRQSPAAGMSEEELIEAAADAKRASRRERRRRAAR
jgi:predicted DNA-binding protein